MIKHYIVKVGSQYVTDGGTLSPNQGDAQRIAVPQSSDPNVHSASPRIVAFKVRPSVDDFDDDTF